MLQHKKILIGISGGIAAYKTAILIRLFKKAGADVKVVVSKNALQFITELTLQTLSGNSVYKDVFDQSNDYSTEHISVADWADICIVAPATANIIGKVAAGIADDALSTTLLAIKKPIYLAPAMNTAMYEHVSVQRNINFLASCGITIIEPATGQLACNTEGKGRMEEPHIIFEKVLADLKKKSRFNNKRVLVTAGPTYEAIDPVRFIGNHSSGKMGIAIAQAFADEGAQVTLIAGPTSIQTSSNMQRINVTSSEDMFLAVTDASKKNDIIVMAAAVADYKPKQVASQKIKKTESTLDLQLEKTKDILAAIGHQKTPEQILVGFALETDNEIEHAIKKLNTKNLDCIVLNSLRDKDAGFAVDTNKISIIGKDQQVKHYETKNKKDVAKDICDYIYTLMPA